jgi:anti-sigma B factor antagonist
MNLTAHRNTRTHPTSPKPRSHPADKVVSLLGDLDMATTPALRKRLDQALDTTAGTYRRLVIDLSGVSFCDAAGLALLIGAQRRAWRLGTPMCLAAPQPQMKKLLHITGLDRSLTIQTTVTATMRVRPTAALA